MDVAGSDASQGDDPVPEPELKMVHKVRKSGGSSIAASRVIRMVPTRVPPAPSSVPDSAREAQPRFWWAAARRGAYNQRHFAKEWQELSPAEIASGSMPQQPVRHRMISICYKKFMRCVNGKEDA